MSRNQEYYCFEAKDFSKKHYFMKKNKKLMYKSGIDRARSLINETEQKIKSMGIAQKISMNLLFDKTKTNLKQSIEELEKTNNDLKEKQLNLSQIKRSHKFTSNQDYDFQHQTQTKNRKQKDKINNKKQQQFDPTLVQQPPSPLMIATLQQKQGYEGSWLQIALQLKGPEQLLKITNEHKNSQHFTKIFFRFQVDKNLKDQQLISFNRKYFKSCYEKARKAVIQIDFISSKKDHFQLVFKHSTSNKIQTNKQQMIKISYKQCENQVNKQSTIRKINSFCAQQFLSFPQRTLVQQQFQNKLDEYQLVLINHSKDGTYIKRQDTQKWQLVLSEIDINDGDLICPLMKKPHKTQPSFWFQVKQQQLIL